MFKYLAILMALLLFSACCTPTVKEKIIYKECNKTRLKTFYLEHTAKNFLSRAFRRRTDHELKSHYRLSTVKINV